MPETTASTGSAISDGEAMSIIFIVLLVMFAISAFLLIMLIKGLKKAQEKKELWRQGIFQPVQADFPHVAGLPVPIGTRCSLYLTENGLALSALGNNFNISVDKLTTITSKTDTEIQKSTQYVSSAAGAVVGAMMFGAVGAMIGGRAKEKESTITTEKHYMVVTYKKDDSIDYLLFELNGIPERKKAIHFEKNLELLVRNRPSETIEL